MRYLFTPDGQAALAALLSGRPLIALDFDGTLAEIVDRPDDAHIAPDLAMRLAALAERLPVAIVTGRSVDDVKGRLGFRPGYVVGHHGAEDGGDAAATARRVGQVDPLRRRLAQQRQLLTQAGIRIEDKGQSMALHYRQAADPDRARALIDALLHGLDASLRSFGGKMVVNVVPRHAPDKAVAVHKLVAACAATAALFAGDDVNDEPVFDAAPPHWLTIRVGHDEPASRARYFIRSPRQMRHLIDHVLTQVTGRPVRWH